MTAKEYYDLIEGDYNTVLSRMMMDSFILRMLNKFKENNTFNAIKENYQNKNFQAVFEAAHNFKGVCGNLALDGLFNKVVPIVEGTRCGSPASLDKEIQELEEQYNLVINNIDKMAL